VGEVQERGDHLTLVGTVCLLALSCGAGEGGPRTK
jgi:hypothetical protein